MNLEYRSLIDPDFASDSRVWIYQCSRLFSLGEALELEESLHQFASTWQSHGTPVKGAAYLFFGQFIILMADESATGVSGCSTDSSVRFIKELEQRYRVNLFNRTMLAFVKEEKIQRLPLSQLHYAIENGFINRNTLYFNNTVLSKKMLEDDWIIPLGESWLSKKYPALQAGSTTDK